MRKYLLLGVCAFFLFSSCDNLKKKEDNTESNGKKIKKPLNDEEEEEPSDPEVKKEKKKPQPVTDELTTNSEADILNKIVVQESGGVKVARAYLAYEDGSLVSKNNTASLNQPVYLFLLIDKGWQAEDGNVSIDASERIETDGGELVVNAPNLFKDYTTVDEAKAKSIQLKAVITQTRPGIDHFVVSYRVWDKKGDGEVKGSYKLYIKDETE